MKIIPWFVRWQIASRPKTKNAKPHVPENAEPFASESVPASQPVPFSNDDSPPGHKIRWHH